MLKKRNLHIFRSLILEVYIVIFQGEQGKNNTEGIPCMKQRVGLQL